MQNNRNQRPDKIKTTFSVAEKALKDIISEGGKVSQYAVEKRAGLSNGALNYKAPEYIELKERINAAKAVRGQHPTKKVDTEKLKKEKSLKSKYRGERDEAKEELKKALGEKMELLYQLFHLQSYLNHLENKGVASADVIDISRRFRYIRKKNK
ncbi:MAG: hypothetical protein KZQ64_13680 [gamma proteobacterium symbiont of Bathyaustriella thionipta]|nr:hypothetical protein [gamma proteobacterium symbiont of Bathyaustriella thionipta]MCU7951146.1 hypothetical protein [gamma proteobacterium symbiont of Bathyaustriella thionipta]MCU7954420.1 hypothetical protein [gamma proteobacterium symbiont of Bathyaustriella thionipta]MCU7957659.1 hypothetical protein [gamma proteobacterium symbiont of Bathyaustriella thionipta]MCU7966673.1 hypothetical protein [gamma proteobacterium symbiont of Bathyaustriella thionipta]